MAGSSAGVAGQSSTGGSVATTGGTNGVGGSGGSSNTTGSGGKAASGGTGGKTTTGGTGGGTATGGTATGGTGGSTATGGSGGSLPPRPCDSLPAAGTWENISPAGFTNTTALIVDPFEAGVVWLGTTDNGLYKSTDCGATFVHTSTGQNASTLNAAGQGLLSVAVDPVDRGVIYVFKYGGHGVLKSTNGGVDWFQTIADGSEVANAIPSKYIDSISMDPTDHKHLVTSNHVNCNPPYDPTCQAETTDGGQTWRVFKSAPGTGWEEGGGVFVVNATTWLYAGLHLYVTTDRGANFKLLDPDPAQWWGFNGGEVETHSIARDDRGNYYLGANQGVITSPDGKSWSLIPNSGGRTVGLVLADGQLFTSDQWSASVHTASTAAPTKWTSVPPPGIPSGQGCPYVDYDTTHRILYLSCYAAGAWRRVMP